MGEKQDQFDAQQGLCWLCDKPMDLQASTWDHVIPKSAGGTWDPSNLKLAHSKCNGLRRSIPAEQARAYVQAALEGRDAEAENRVRRLLGFPPLSA